MSWASAVKRTTKQPAPAAPSFQRPAFDPAVVDSSRLVRLDFETYYDDDYTLSKLSTSEYIRDPRFEALMVGIRVGNAKTKVVPGPKIAAELRKIPWAFYDLLCHHTHFDGLILSHHYGIVPRKYYCSLSMARGLHSNDIGAGLDDVSKYYDGAGKLETGTEDFKGLNYKALFANKVKWGNAVRYCGQDVDEMDRIFWKMLPKMPASEIDLIHTIVRMFCDPVLKVDIPRVEKELAREIVEREERLLTAVDEKNYSEAEVKEILKTKAERALIGKERQMLFSKRVIGSGERFAALLRAEGVEPPVKISPAWMKKPVAERDDESKWTYAFAKDDLDFTSLPDRIEEFLTNLNLNKKKDILELALRQTRLQQLVDARLAVKSTTNITRAERFLKAGANGMPLPVGYAYYRAHCVPGYVEVLTREGWTRLSAWSGGEIAQVHSDQRIEFLPATKFAGPVETEWLQIRAPYLNCDFTLGHTMPYFTQKGRKWATEKAGNLVDRNAFDVPISGQLISAGAITPEQMRVLVMVQADGSYETDSAIGRRMMVFVKKPRKIERARQLFRAAGVVYSERTYPSHPEMVRFIVKYADYPNWLTPERKFFGAWLLDSTPEARDAFLAELEHWDGFRDHAGCAHYSSSERANAEWAVTLAHLSGKGASICTAPAKGNRRENYTVAFRERSFTKISKQDKYLVHSPMHTFCASTQTGFWLARVGDRIFVTGNTGRLGGSNKMNMQNLKRGGELRLSILAPKGHEIVVVDSGQIEARVNGWLWGQEDLLDAFRAADTWDKARGVARGGDRDAYCKMGDLIYGREITTDDKTERFVGKVCFAEGELVLTQRGLVPIENISKLDRLWDGLEWVSHDGLIDQGVREVITYQGLTATPDHEVFVEDGRIIPLGQAASEMVGLVRTGAEGQNLRFCDDHVVADTPRKRLSVYTREMRTVGGGEAHLAQQFDARQDDLVPTERSASGPTCRAFGTEVRRDQSAVQQSEESCLGAVRRAGNPVSLQNTHGVHPLDCNESPTSALHRSGDRPHRQQLTLHAGESTAGDADSTSTESPKHQDGVVGGAPSPTCGIPQPIQPELDVELAKTRPDGGRNSRKVRVYDIANAGPRHRYTVSGNLVLNCVLGLGYQMGAPKLQITLAKGALGGPPVYFELDKCHQIVNAYRRKNNQIEGGWKICSKIIEDMAAGVCGHHGPISWEKETLWLPNGMALKYPDLKKRQGDKGFDEWTYQGMLKNTPVRKKIYGGLLCLGAKTEVLTSAGWKSIVEVSSNDKLWDGVEWVSHSGLSYRGVKKTIDFGGVAMTPDHEVLVEGAWVEAQHTGHHEATSSFARHHRLPMRNADGDCSHGQRWASNLLVGALRLWKRAAVRCFGIPEEESQKLRVRDLQTTFGSQDHSRNVEAPGVCGMAQHAGSLSATDPSILGALRRTRNQGLQALADLRGLLGGHARQLCAWAGLGPTGQLTGVLQGQLPLGDSQGERSQHPRSGTDRYAPRPYAAMASRRDLRHRHDDAALPPYAWMASGANVRSPERHEQDVYDLVDAGPRKRFTVRGADGRPFLVHNCENIVQALARIIVMAQLLEIDKKYRVVMTTHDENVALAKTKQAPAALKFMLAAMRKPLPWCADIPLNAEGGHALNYSK